MKPISQQAKHLTKSEILEKEMIEENMICNKDQLKNPPSWLINEIAKQEWIRITKEIYENKNSFICNLDFNNLGGYCNAFAKYQKLTIKVGTKFTIGRDVNPFINLELKYSEEMRKYGSLLGLSIESRAKAGKVQVTKQQEDIGNEFGDV